MAYLGGRGGGGETHTRTQSAHHHNWSTSNTTDKKNNSNRRVQSTGVYLFWKKKKRFSGEWDRGFPWKKKSCLQAVCGASIAPTITRVVIDLMKDMYPYLLTGTKYDSCGTQEVCIYGCTTRRLQVRASDHVLSAKKLKFSKPKNNFPQWLVLRRI